MPTPALKPNARSAALNRWRSDVARSAAGYVALNGGRCLAVDVAKACGIPEKAVRQILCRFPAFEFGFVLSDDRRHERLVICLRMPEPAVPPPEPQRLRLTGPRTA